MFTVTLPALARLRMSWRCACAVLLLVGSGASLSSAAPDETPAPDGTRDELRLLARDGHPLHVTRYRPPVVASAGVVLIHEWGAGAGACWGDLPQLLCRNGFEVLVPDLRGHGESLSPSAVHPLAPTPTRVDLALLAGDAALWAGAFGDSVEGVLVVAVGWVGTVAARVVAAGRSLLGLIWLGPLGDAAAFDWQAGDLTHRALLLIATQEEMPSARTAEAIYARFHATAELRTFTRGEGGCALLNAPGARDGVMAWVRQRAPDAGVDR